MHTTPSLEERLAAVESALAELQRRLGGTPPAVNWIERFTGSFKDEPAFKEVVEYGRQVRQADSSQENQES